MERSSEASSTISQLSKVGLGDSKSKSPNPEKLGNSSYFPKTPPIPPGSSNIGGGRPSIPNLAGLTAHSAMNDVSVFGAFCTEKLFYFLLILLCSLSLQMVPPPLPPHILASLPGDDSEALSAMLMSWYMSGFHTGSYCSA